MKTKAYSKRIVSVCLSISLMFVCVPMTFMVKAEAPTFDSGINTNVANYMTVIAGTTDYTSTYDSTKQVEILPSQYSTFSNITYGSINSFVYSADVTFIEDPSTYGRISLVIGQGVSIADSKTKYIEVCIRPKLKHAVIFGSATGASEESVAVWGAGCENIAIGNTYKYTVQYESGVISFWLDGVQMFGGPVDCSSNFTSITPCTGTFSQSCTGTVSNIEIYGDATNTVPRIGLRTNAANNMFVAVGSTSYTNTYRSTSNIALGAGERADLSNINYAGSSEKAVSCTATWTRPASYSAHDVGIVIGIGTFNGETSPIRAVIRPFANSAYIFTTGDKVIASKASLTSTYWASSKDMALKYVDGKVSLWISGADGWVFNSVDLAALGVTNFTFAPGFYARTLPATYSNIKVYGDDVSNQFETIGANTNAAQNMYLYNSSTNYTKAYNNSSIYFPTNRYYNFSDISYANNKYYFTADAIYPEVAGITHEALVFRVGSATLNSITVGVFVEVRHGVAFIYAGSINKTYKYINTTSAADTTYNYKVKYDNGYISFWRGETLIFNSVNVATEFSCTDVAPNTGVGIVACSGTFSNILVYGTGVANNSSNIAPTNCPVYNNELNAADYMTVVDTSNNSYAYTNETVVGSSKYYLFKSIPTVNEFVYSATVNMATAGTVRLLIANGYVDTTKRDIVLLICNNRVSIYDNSSEYQISDAAITIGIDSNITYSYNNGVIMLWKDYEQLILSYDLTATYSNVTPSFGVDFNTCTGTLSNIKIYGSDIATAANVTIGTLTNGTVTIANPFASFGDTVTVTVTPSSGYQLKAGSLTYTTTTSLETKYIINRANDTASNMFVFTLPDEKVEINAEFVNLATTNVSVATMGTSLHFTGASYDGIRFVTRMYLPEISYNVQSDDFQVNYNGAAYKVVDYGALLVPTQIIVNKGFTNNDLTLANATTLNVVKVSAKSGKIFDITNCYVDFTVVMMSTYQDRIYVTRGYIELEPVSGGNNVVVYADVFTDCITAAQQRISN